MSKYNRENIYKYAEKWALSRNPKYYNYDYIGGDCTNFVSQCIYAGCGQMNYNRLNGWYYINANNKSPSWTGVEFLYDFLISNKGSGPRGEDTSIDKLEIGDIVQLSFEGLRFSHGLVVIQSGTSVENTLIAAHTYDVFRKRVSDYGFEKYRCIHLI
ncbi:MAG: amidase domain-containing protein [Clostridia bacterium]|nr:amidase domain-containing protein [Clostridia bacterium]